MITLRSINRVYPLKGGPFYALRNIDLEIGEGEFVSIMGPSGSGKSTLLHVLGLHDSAWDGEYWFGGEPVHKLDKKRRFELQKKNIGFIFQSYHLLDDLTVYENLEIPLSYRDVPKKQRESIVCDALDRFHIVAKRDLYPNQLSGGQQQLVGVARALVAKPSAHPGRRAHRQPPLRPGPRDHAALQAAQPGGRRDHRPGHPLQGERRLRPASCASPTA
jgi:putative ABC transport system ATP-binding protein